MGLNKLVYRKAFKEFGISAKGVHWNSKQTQYKRFDILIDFIKTDIKKSEIVDIGSGFSELFIYLLNRELEPKVYIGIDCEDWMVKLAAQRFPSEIYNTSFSVKDAIKNTLPMADYYLCSGGLNLLIKEEFFKFIDNCYNSSKKGFIFNFLKSNPYNNITVQDVMRYTNRYKCNIKTKSGYLENDYTIFLKKV